MKLASYADGSRDGHLVVVSRDLTQAHYATGIATRLQQVLDDWGFLAPQLEDLAVQLNHGKLRHAFPFDPDKCVAPLRAPARPEAALAAIAGDLAAASDTASALDALRLLTLAVDWRLDDELIATQAAPLAVTPDELGEAWRTGRVQARLHVLHNGAKQPVQDIDAQPGAALARVARLRALRAGQVVGTALALPDLPLAAGDSLHLDLKTADGASLFGAIDLDIAPDAP